MKEDGIAILFLPDQTDSWERICLEPTANRGGFPLVLEKIRLVI